MATSAAEAEAGGELQVKNLFGEEISVADALAVKRRPRVDRAHAAEPGTGPRGKLCRDCASYTRIDLCSKVFRKCAVVKAGWTHGPGTDIRAHDRACRMFTE